MTFPMSLDRFRRRLTVAFIVVLSLGVLSLVLVCVGAARGNGERVRAAPGRDILYFHPFYIVSRRVALAGLGAVAAHRPTPRPRASRAAPAVVALRRHARRHRGRGVGAPSSG